MALDERLIEQLKSGQPAAYAVLVEQFEGPLYRFFLCDHRNHHLAEEQAAETFAQLVRTLPAMRGGTAQLRAYVFSIARHMQLRRWRQHYPRPSPLADAADIADPNSAPSALADAREQVDRVLNAMNALEDPLRQILFLRFVEECSLDEIATALQLPIGTIKSHISRGREKLKRIMTNEECKP